MANFVDHEKVRQIQKGLERLLDPAANVIIAGPNLGQTALPAPVSPASAPIKWFTNSQLHSRAHRGIVGREQFVNNSLPNTR